MSITHQNDRGRSPSVKRKPDGQEVGNESEQEGEYSEPVKRGFRARKPRPVQYGTSAVNVVGGDAAPYEVFIGNTNPASTEDIIKQVLQECAQNMSGEIKLTEQLEILDVQCITKPRDDGYPIRTKSWRVRVPHKFRDHMLRVEAYPVGWSSRRYFPPRAPRPAVPPLNPEKRPNLGQAVQPEGHAVHAHQ